MLVEAGLSFALLVAFLNRPLLMPVKRKSSLAWRPRSGRY